MNTYSRTTRVPALILAIVAAVILLYVGQTISSAVEDIRGASQTSSTDTYKTEG